MLWFTYFWIAGPVLLLKYYSYILYLGLFAFVLFIQGHLNSIRGSIKIIMELYKLKYFITLI